MAFDKDSELKGPLSSMGTIRETRRNVLIMALFVTIAAGGAFALSLVTADLDLKKELQTASLTLVFGSLLGGMVKFLLDDFDRGRQQRAEKAQFFLNVLSDLKSVYDRTERAKILIAAHQSAKTYGEEMRDLIEARVKLLNVIRAINVQSVSGSRQDLRVDAQNIGEMEKYLKALIDEFENKYKGISEEQRKYEAAIKTYVEKLGQDPSRAGKPPDNEPWKGICEIEIMKDFLNLKKLDAGNTNYDKQFLSHLDAASEQLTDRLRRALE